MSSTDTRSFLSRIFGSPNGVSTLPDDRHFLHDRVRLYLKILFFFFAFFVLIALTKFAVFLFAPTGIDSDWIGATVWGNLIVIVLTALLGAGWFYLRKQMRPVPVLHLFESAGTVMACAMIGSLIRYIPVGLPIIGLTLSMVLVLVIRAAVVPSTAFRTVLVGLLATVTLTIPTFKHGAGGGFEIDPLIHEMMTLHLWGIVLTWGIIFSVATMIVSQVIYGLHRKVRQAMQLGNYTLDQKLGEGGMGMVYLAHHALLNRPTALKLLAPEKAGEFNVARFEREVQQTSRLSHPNTVEIYDYGRTPDGIFYYVMEYLDGLNLEELIKLEGPQLPGRVIHILSQVAHALAEAHEAGLVHRDIKPANIVLCNRGGVADMAKVVDFGLIKDIKAPAELALSTADTLTGTPLYMAPEALTAPGSVDGRADLYALGAVGYFALSGHHLFESNSLIEVCSHHLHTVPVAPSAALGNQLPRDLESVILRCLEKKPADRYTNAMELRNALLQCQDAKEWSLSEATGWWSRNRDRVRAFHHDKRRQNAKESSGERLKVSKADAATRDLKAAGVRSGVS